MYHAAGWDVLLLWLNPWSGWSASKGIPHIYDSRWTNKVYSFSKMIKFIFKIMIYIVFTYSILFYTFDGFDTDISYSNLELCASPLTALQV